MENPREDVKDVILGLLDRPTLRGQAAVLKKYCLPDVEFFYLYFNTKGLREMTVIYQVAQILANYQGVTFDQISYDETTNLVNIWTHVMLRPWPLYWRGNIPLSIFTVLELEDVEPKRPDDVAEVTLEKFTDAWSYDPLLAKSVGSRQDIKGKRTPRTVKMIKTQRDWFEFSPIIRVIPFVGDIYANQHLRFTLGNIVAETAMVGLKLLEFLLPSKLEKTIFG
ncbi:hypothetical protein KC19_4G082600 [Ceratodon purpureus]|uniref:SigF-like NTF2-like domain-containing protein n=1 Tax=Ceratodon purpureus TaxID=3225 RepID=A0A8T0I846_CERPU|nr:hypothetical protein KC19_4G082600 [Ceratodon purpureus]